MDEVLCLLHHKVHKALVYVEDLVILVQGKLSVREGMQQDIVKRWAEEDWLNISPSKSTMAASTKNTKIGRLWPLKPWDKEIQLSGEVKHRTVILDHRSTSRLDNKEDRSNDDAGPTHLQKNVEMKQDMMYWIHIIVAKLMITS